MGKINIGRRTNSILSRDRKVMLTTTRAPYPFVPDRGEGDIIYDVEGNRFIDFSSFVSVYNLGVGGNAEIRRSMTEQIKKLTHNAFTDYYSERPVRFAEKLVSMMPRGFGKVFFSNSGTEANEAALKFSRIFTERQYVMSFYGAFHGRTGGVLGMTSSKPVQKEHFGPFPNVIHAIYPDTYRNPFNIDDADELSDACIEHIEKDILGKGYSQKEISAIFIEPMQGESGYVIPPKRFMKELRRVATENGILLVADEIQTGYMRTGKFLALDNFNVQADIYTLAKSLGGGTPIGATITRTSLGDIPAGSHANTFGGNLLAIAAAEASLDYVRRNMRSLQRNIKERGAYIMKRLGEMKDKYEIVGDYRGIGLFIGMELVKDRKTKEPAVKGLEDVLKECFYNGLIILPAGKSVVRIIPPLTVSQKSVESGMDILEEAVKKADAKSKN